MGHCKKLINDGRVSKTKVTEKGRRKGNPQKPPHPDPSNVQSAKKPGERAASASPKPGP